MSRVGVLALQGAFREHVLMLRELGAEVCEIRQLKDLEQINSIVIPGGESTTIGKLLVELEILEPLREKINNGLPAFGTCAGLILLCKNIEDSQQPRLGVLNATVRRNAFGRQIDSFESSLPVPAFGDDHFPAVFIRAPIIIKISPEIKTLATVIQDEKEWPVAIRQNNILATSFHPELTRDKRAHAYFLDMIREN